MIYLDNAATSFPKPPSLAEATAEFLATQAVNPGRSGFDLSLQAGRRIDDLRKRLSQFFNHSDQNPDRVVFTSNATDALNLAIQGICRPGDHIVATVLEHNSVLRPLFELQKGDISHDLAPCDARGFVHPESIEALIRPETRLVIMTHASNVLGTIQPAAEVGALCQSRGIHFLLDTAQTAGTLPVDMAALGADLLAFTGHKGLLGPTGTGGLLVANKVNVRPIRWGGTGVFSAQQEHPEKYPYRLEAGTLNTTGLVGLEASLDWLQNHHPAEMERNLSNRLLAGLGEIPSIKVLGLEKGENDISLANRTAVTSILVDGMPPEKTGVFLDMEWNIAVRTGLQCAPLAHRAMGTENEGTIRISPGPFNSPEDIDCLLDALASFKT